MPGTLTPRQLTGLDESHLLTLDSGHRLRGEVAQAFAALRADARRDGFELAIASSFRSYSRQLAIWNGKVRGERQVLDDTGNEVDVAALADSDKLRAILRFSAIPGTSRHHWGTDLDVYDAAVMPEDYQLQLSLREVAPGGMFDPLHRWLDERMARGASHGFYRPYAADRGGIAPERWHLSYAPLSRDCAAGCDVGLFRAAWDDTQAPEALLLRAQVEAELGDILERYIAVPTDWDR
jgi:LAS superfamily LD-carboxypeptidase LdcB